MTKLEICKKTAFWFLCAIFFCFGLRSVSEASTVNCAKVKKEIRRWEAWQATKKIWEVLMRKNVLKKCDEDGDMFLQAARLSFTFGRYDLADSLSKQALKKVEGKPVYRMYKRILVSYESRFWREIEKDLSTPRKKGKNHVPGSKYAHTIEGEKALKIRMRVEKRACHKLMKGQGEKALKVGCRYSIPVNIRFHFDFAKATLRKEAHQGIERFAEIAKKNILEGRRLILLGHTDQIGGFQTNQQLSKKRAQTIRNELIKRGVAADRIFFDGVGYANPIAPNDTEDGRALNRRVECSLVSR